ncbi:MAG TPA: DUF1329 domain-containing protein [Terriglobales bacterium]|nr:DUF1329 domain-containing protein [Terriglobales bacterium]
MEQVSEGPGMDCVRDAADAHHPDRLGAASGVSCALFLIICLLLGGKAQGAPVLFDPANYANLAASDSAETIKPGTQITLGNWQRYKRFMPVGIQVLYSGRHFLHVDSSSDFTITVGPTIRYTWPRRYWEDTEKYGNQTRLLRLDSGGYTIKNYIAGLPFPIAHQPNLADKAMYNARYAPNPAVLWWPWTAFMLDRFLNLRIISEGSLEVYRLSHLSAPGLPINPDYGKGYLNSLRADVSAPENVKYSVQLTLRPDDPTRVSEQYLYLPQLRRSYRYSTGGRCTYQNGSSDSTTRDFSFEPANGRNTLLGEARILAFEHAAGAPAVLYSLEGIHVKSYVPGWPKPVLGRWELRDVYVIDSVFVPDNPGRKCFSHTVLYIDKDNWQLVCLEDYDAEGKLWKENMYMYMEVPNPALKGNFMILHHQTVLNLKENHATVAIATSAPKLDDDVPGEYRNAPDAALPGSIMSINK